MGAFVTGILENQDDGKLFKYWTTRYFDDADYKFDDWISEVRKRSWYSNDIECTADDKYISLSTCTNETSNLRWVIVAKKMTADDNLDLIIDSYKDKANKDIYFLNAGETYTETIRSISAGIIDVYYTKSV